METKNFLDVLEEAAQRYVDTVYAFGNFMGTDDDELRTGLEKVLGSSDQTPDWRDRISFVLPADYDGNSSLVSLKFSKNGRRSTIAVMLGEIAPTTYDLSDIYKTGFRRDTPNGFIKGDISPNNFLYLSRVDEPIPLIMSRRAFEGKEKPMFRIVSDTKEGILTPFKNSLVKYLFSDLGYEEIEHIQKDSKVYVRFNHQKH